MSHVRPAAQFVKIFTDPKANVQALFTIFVGFIQKLFQEPIGRSDRCGVTRSLLDGLGRRPDGVVLLTSLRQSPFLFWDHRCWPTHLRRL